MKANSLIRDSKLVLIGNKGGQLLNKRPLYSHILMRDCKCFFSFLFAVNISKRISALHNIPQVNLIALGTLGDVENINQKFIQVFVEVRNRVAYVDMEESYLINSTFMIPTSGSSYR